MPMEKNEDFARGDSRSSYCRYCTDEAGKLLPYEKILIEESGSYRLLGGVAG
jgi:hypothetical protein